MFDLPEVEALFMPTNMDSSQMAFKFKEVIFVTIHLSHMLFTMQFCVEYGTNGFLFFCLSYSLSTAWPQLK